MNTYTLKFFRYGGNSSSVWEAEAKGDSFAHALINYFDGKITRETKNYYYFERPGFFCKTKDKIEKKAINYRYVTQSTQEHHTLVEIEWIIPCPDKYPQLHSLFENKKIIHKHTTSPNNEAITNIVLLEYPDQVLEVLQNNVKSDEKNVFFWVSFYQYDKGNFYLVEPIKELSNTPNTVCCLQEISFEEAEKMINQLLKGCDLSMQKNKIE